MKQPIRDSFDAAIDRIIEHDRMKDETPYLYARIMQGIENSRKEEQLLLPPLFTRFAIASIVIFLSFNLLLVLNAPDCTPSAETEKNSHMEPDDPHAVGIDYDNITDILLNQ